MPSVVQRAPYALWFPPNHKIIYLVYNTLSHNKNVTALQYARYRRAGKPVIHVDRCMYYGLFLCPFNIKMYHIRKIRSRNWKSADTMICTHFPGHILFTSLNTWMLPCILQEASILFFSGSFCCCNS